MKNTLLKVLCLASALVGAAWAVNNAIIVVANTEISSGSSNKWHHQPTSSSGANWLVGWHEWVLPTGTFVPVARSYVSDWNTSTGNWNSKKELKTPSGQTLGNLFTSRDSVTGG